MRYVSLFSGVEAATVAWRPLGWVPVAFAEIEEFPSAVLAYRFPDVPNLGDVTQIDWRDFYERYGAVDVLVGGSPCQSFSIAGKREGLSGESGLMFEYIRAVRELVRASGGQSPRYILWENVPGALSSERGVAFGQLLAELGELGYGLAWRILDAQFARVPDGSPDGFFGPVAQRRRRVFLVGVLGSPHAIEILAERSSMRRDNPSSREARKVLAADPNERPSGGSCAGFKYHQGSGAGNIGYELESSQTLTADYHQPAICLQTDHLGQNGKNHSVEVCKTLDVASATPVVMTQYGDIAGTLAARADSSPCADRGQNVVCFNGVNANDVAHIGESQKEIAPALRASRSGTNGTPVVCIQDGQVNATICEDGTCTTLNASHEQPIIIDRAAFNQGENAKYPPPYRADGCDGHLGGEGSACCMPSNGEQVVGALCARDWKGVGSQYVSEGKVICQRF